MRKFRVKWTLPVLFMIALLSIPAVAEGGGRWSRMDPILEMNGHTINVFATWPSENNCDIKGPVKFKMSAPGAVFIEDSKDTFDCEDGGEVELSTKTKLSQRGEEGTLKIRAHFKATADFPVGVLVYVDGKLVRECEGHSNKAFKCRPIDID